MCKYVFSKLNLDMEKYIHQDKVYMRPQELDYLRGDATKAKNIGLGASN